MIKKVLEFSFRVGVWGVRFSVPPCPPGKTLAIVAYWSPGGYPGLHNMTAADRAVYEREKRAILGRLEAMLGRGPLKYAIAHRTR